MTNATSEGLTCTNPDCRIAETGKCVEGFEVGECPHQRAVSPATDVPPPTAEDDESIVEIEGGDVPVASGDILNIDEATDVLRCGPNSVLTIVGPIKSGKTTLGISLYDSFQHSPFGRWRFAGSLTLKAFEERCHLARVASGMTSPDTERTSIQEGLGFLHLAIHSAETGRIDLLISDRSGEFYSRVADSQEDCENLHEVKRADFVLFLVDGEKLVSDERHGVKSDVLMMIQTLIEGALLGKGHRIGIALTKYDLIISSIVKERADKDFDTLIETVKIRFGSAVGGISTFRVAARPTKNVLEPRFGILEILEECSRPRELVNFVSPAVVPLDRWFFRLPMVHGDTK